MDVADLKRASEQRIAELRRALEEEERFLRDLDRRVRAKVSEVRPVTRGMAALRNSPQAAEAGRTGLRRVPNREKVDVILQLLQDAPGPLTPKEVREGLRSRGIDPDAGTEVKRVLWQLGRDGDIARHPDQGAYGPIAPS